MYLRRKLTAIIVAASMAMAPVATRASGIPVVDVAALAQLIQQIMYWQQQIQSMSDQLNQMKSTYNSLNGSRGLGNLMTLSNAQRNYLPTDHAEIVKVLNGVSTQYSGLSSKVSAVMSANAVLSSTDLAAMTPSQKAMIEDGRRAAAMISTLSQTGYQNTSGRFAQLQSLITAINATADPKAIAEIQARIAGEQTMLANEQTKMQTIFYMAQAEQIAQEQRAKEKRVAAHGAFSSRPTIVFP
ncbi:type IV secretion system protein [Denitromonas iodatirespirans]|uniref:type IV secretion system protein n=1 Tax=Denitromonas iodatirespirans TaxID=2795389 RepID=UPI001E41EED5|nr:type IV secretion system protein [Denitromonas iodatirespirans]